MSIKGWECPKCQRVYAPHISECDECNKDKFNFNPIPYPIPITVPYVQTYPADKIKFDCGCPNGTVCMNTACPRRTEVTYGSTTYAEVPITYTATVSHIN